MRIIVDMDEVLCQFVKRMLEVWNGRHGTNVTREQISMWNLDATCGPGAWKEIAEFIGQRDFFANLEPVEGAIKGMEAFRAAGHDIVIATHVNGAEVGPGAYAGKRDWVCKHLPWFKLDSLVFISRKGLLDGDVLIDDGEHNIADWRSAHRKNGLIFDAPWNKHMQNGYWTFRVHNWDEVRAEVQLIQDKMELERGRAEHGVIS